MPLTSAPWRDVMVMRPSASLTVTRAPPGIAKPTPSLLMPPASVTALPARMVTPCSTSAPLTALTMPPSHSLPSVLMDTPNGSSDQT